MEALELLAEEDEDSEDVAGRGVLVGRAMQGPACDSLASQKPFYPLLSTIVEEDEEEDHGEDEENLRDFASNHIVDQVMGTACDAEDADSLPASYSTLQGCDEKHAARLLQDEGKENVQNYASINQLDS